VREMGRRILPQKEKNWYGEEGIFLKEE